MILVFAFVLYVLKKLPRPVNSQAQRRLPLIGQTIHGVVVGCTFGIYFHSEEQKMELQSANLLGTAVGLALAYFALSAAYLFELLPDQGITGDLFYVIHSLVLAGCIARFAAHDIVAHVRVVIAALAANVLIFV